jgi:hypothetical protein
VAAVIGIDCRTPHSSLLIMTILLFHCVE